MEPGGGAVGVGLVGFGGVGGGRTWIERMMLRAMIVPIGPLYWNNSTSIPGRNKRMFILTPSASLRSQLSFRIPHATRYSRVHHGTKVPPPTTHTYDGRVEEDHGERVVE